MELNAYLLLKEFKDIQNEYVTSFDYALDEETRHYSALNNYMWEEADETTQQHTAITEVFMPLDDVETSCNQFVKLICSLIDDNVVGVYMNDVIYEPEFYLTMGKMIDQELFPIYNVVWFGLYPFNNKVGAYTNGLETLGYHEVELTSVGDPMDIIEFLKDTALYVITNDVHFKDGETIGLTMEQVLKIEYSPSNIFNGDTFKIEDPFYEN